MPTSRTFVAVVILICCSVGCTAKPVPQHQLQFLGERKLLDHLRGVGFRGDSVIVVGKSRDRAKLVARDREHNYYLLESHKNPRLLDWPRYQFVWLDGDCQPLAWSDNAARGLVFRNGKTLRSTEPGMQMQGVTQYSDFFWFRNATDGITQVYSSEEPQVPLLRIVDGPAGYPPDEVLTHGTSLYLVTYVDAGENCWVYERADGDWVLKRRITIPGQVVDVHPETGMLLLLEQKDMPFPDPYFLYDMDTGRSTRVGYTSNTIALVSRAEFLPLASRTVTK
jgi:hypothetical protein